MVPTLPRSVRARARRGGRRGGGCRAGGCLDKPVSLSPGGRWANGTRLNRLMYVGHAGEAQQWRPKSIFTYPLKLYKKEEETCEPF